jgi:hypothetical protein
MTVPALRFRSLPVVIALALTVALAANESVLTEPLERVETRWRRSSRRPRSCLGTRGGRKIARRELAGDSHQRPTGALRGGAGASRSR